MAQHAKDVARSQSGPVVDSSIFRCGWRMLGSCVGATTPHSSTTTIPSHAPLHRLVSAVTKERGPIEIASLSSLAHQTKSSDRQVRDKLIQWTQTFKWPTNLKFRSSSLLSLFLDLTSPNILSFPAAGGIVVGSPAGPDQRSQALRRRIRLLLSPPLFNAGCCTGVLRRGIQASSSDRELESKLLSN